MLTFILSLLIFVVAVWLGILFFQQNEKRSKGRNAPPFEPGLPLIGCLFQYGLDPIGYIKRLHQKYGDIFAMNLAGRYIVLVCNTDSIRSYYRASEDVLSANDAFQDFGFRKKSLAKVPNLNRHILLMRVHSEIDYFMSIYSQYFYQFTQSVMKENSGKVELFELSKEISRKAFIATFVGPELLDMGFVNDFYDYEKVKGKAITKLILLPKAFSKDTWEIVNTKRERLHKMLIDMLVKKLGTSDINEIMKQNRGEHGDYIKYIVQYHQEHKLEHMLTIETLSDYMLDIVFGASGNPSILTAQILIELAEHPEYREKIVQEIESRFGKQIDPKELEPKNLTELHTLDTCVKETLRKCTHPIGSMRKLKQNMEFTTSDNKTYIIPEGAFVGIPHNLLAMDSCAYSKPEEFDPERFSEERSEHRAQPFAYVPFSNGRHGCPGRNIAMHTTKIHIIQFLSNYDFKIDGKVPPMFWGGGSTLAKRKGNVFATYSRK